MKVNKIIGISALSMLCAGSLFAAQDTTANTGNWSDSETWSDGAPTSTSTFIVSSDSTLTVDGEQIAGAIYTNWDYKTYSSEIIISGSENSLTLTGDTTIASAQLWYDCSLTISVLNGGSLTAEGLISWGSGGNFNLVVSGEGSTFDFVGFSQTGGSADPDNSKILFTNGATATVVAADGTETINTINIEAKSSNTMLFEVSNGATFNVNALVLKAATSSTSQLDILNGGVLNATYSLLLGDNYSAGTNIVNIGGAGSKIIITGTGGLDIGASSSLDTNTLNLGVVEDGVLNSIDNGAITVENSFKLYASGEIIFNLSASNAGSDKTAIITTKTLDYLLGEMIINFEFIDGLSDGEYEFALIKATDTDLSTYTEFFDSMTIEGVSSLLEYTGYEIVDDTLYVTINIVPVPEPSTYALIFGALALGLVAYRRRK